MENNKEGKIAEIKKKAENFPVADYAETLLDFCVESEVIKAIPLVSTGVGAFKAYFQYREGKFKEKVKSFVDAIGEMSASDWQSFAESLEKDGKKDQFINELLEIIEKVESEQKSKILGGAFRRLVKQEIEYGQFEDQVRFTNDMLLINIFNFMHCYHNEHVLEESLGDILVSYRMAKRKIELAEKTENMLSATKVQYIKTSYELTVIGYGYLTTLHQVHQEKIEPRFLYTGQPLSK